MDETISGDETKWVAAAQAGDPDAFGRIYSATVGQVRGYVRVRCRTLADAEDTVQDVYLKAWRNIGAYSHERPISAWLVTIARHCLADRVRVAARRREIADVAVGLEGDEVGLVSDRNPGPEDRALMREEADRAMSLLRGLPLRRAAVVAMTADGWTTGEIAEAVGCSENGVRGLRFRAVEAVRSRVETVV